MIAEIAGGLTALKSASELAKAMMDLKEATSVQAKAIELQRQILSAQESALAANERQTTLLERIKALEEEIVRLKKWDANKSDYEFKDLGSGAFAYVTKIDDPTAKPTFWLCVNCFDNGIRGIIQSQGRTKDKTETVWQCSVCKNSFQTHWNICPGRG